MPYFPFSDLSLYYSLLVLFLLFTIFLLLSYRRERRYRRKPYFRFKSLMAGVSRRQRKSWWPRQSCSGATQAG